MLPILRAALIDHHGPHVLDVATGTGRVPLLIAGMPGFNGHIDGLDLTPAMLERARKKAHDLYLDASISWHLGEASSLPWAAESFDLVTCLEALEFFPRPRRSLREMVRVLRPGGMLIVSKYPDNWARMLPGKALTRAGIVRLLHRFGLSDVMIAEWQPGHYELVTARFKLP